MVALLIEYAVHKYHKSKWVERYILERRQYNVCYNTDSSYVDLKDSALLLQHLVYEEAYLGEKVIAR